MQIELLETFLDLMETRSFNKTAERLEVTQSTVSNRVQALEAAVGRRLFSRSRAGTEPTVAGHRFAEHARALRHEWHVARRAIGATGNFAQSMRIGMQHDLAATRIGEWVSEFRQALPHTSFYVELDFSNQMSADLLSGDLDLAVLFTPRNVPDLHYEMVGEIVYRMVSTHAGTMGAIDPQRYIHANYSPAFARSHRQLMPEMGEAAVASGQNAAVCGLLAALGGTAFVLEESAHRLVAEGGYMLVRDAPPVTQPVYQAVHLRHRHSPTHRKLLTILRRHFSATGQR